MYGVSAGLNDGSWDIAVKAMALANTISRRVRPVVFAIYSYNYPSAPQIRPYSLLPNLVSVLPGIPYGTASFVPASMAGNR